MSARPELGVVYPGSQLAYVGTTAILTCYSKRKPVWSKDCLLLAAHLRFLKTLVLSNVQEEDNGDYICSGTYRNDSSFDVKAMLLVGGMIFGNLMEIFSNTHSIIIP